MIPSLDKPILAIVGSTGQQGKSVLAHAYHSGKFHIRALTRNPETEAAKKLKEEFSAIELVAANNNNKESIVKAFEGAHYAFLVTAFWEPENNLNPDTDYFHGKILADAAKAAGVKFIIWSSDHDVEAISKGEYDVPQYTKKNHVEKYLKSIGLEYTAIYAGWFSSNWDRFSVGPVREKDGSLTLALPLRADIGLPVLDTEADFGKFALLPLLNYKEYVGKGILAACEYLTIPQIAAEYTQVTGEPIKIVPIPLEEVPLKELQEMFKYWNHYGYYNGELIDNDSLFGKDKPKLNTFGEWVKRTGFRVPKHK